MTEWRGPVYESYAHTSLRCEGIGTNHTELVSSRQGCTVHQRWFDLLYAAREPLCVKSGDMTRGTSEELRRRTAAFADGRQQNISRHLCRCSLDRPLRPLGDRLAPRRRGNSELARQAKW